MWHLLPISFLYHSHTSRDSYGSSMGKGVPLLGVSEISLERDLVMKMVTFIQLPTLSFGNTLDQQY